MRRARALATGLLSLTLALGVMATAEASPPVTRPDTVTVTAGTPTSIRPTANDTDPDGDELAICRLGKRPRGVFTEPVDGDLWIIAARPGTYTLHYYACDFQSLTRGTITIEVTKPVVPEVRVRKLRRPGKLRVVNRSDFGVTFLWGSLAKARPDGERWIRPGRRIVINVRRPSIVWVAGNERLLAFDLGVVRGIRLPRGVDPLPPGVPKGFDPQDLQPRLRTPLARLL